MSEYTSDSLIAGIKRRGLIPTSQQTYQEADFLDLLNAELNSLIKLLLAAREEFYTTEKVIPLVAGQAAYRIPARSIGSKVSQVVYVEGSQETPLNLIPAEDLHRYAGQTGSPVGYAFQRTSIVVVPTPASASGSLKVTYPRRPNRIVALSAAPEITAINTGTNTVTVGTAPATFVTGTAFDFVQGTPGFDLLASDQVGTVAGNNITFSSLPADLAVGDIIGLAGQTSVAQLPEDLYPLLQHRTLERVAEGMSLQETVAMARRLIEEETAANVNLFSPRADAHPKVIVSEDW